LTWFDSDNHILYTLAWWDARVGRNSPSLDGIFATISSKRSSCGEDIKADSLPIIHCMIQSICIIIFLWTDTKGAKILEVKVSPDFVVRNRHVETVLQYLLVTFSRRAIIWFNSLNIYSIAGRGELRVLLHNLYKLWRARNSATDPPSQQSLAIKLKITRHNEWSYLLGLELHKEISLYWNIAARSLVLFVLGLKNVFGIFFD